MLKIKEENLQYVYQNNEKRGVVMDIPIFEAVMRMLEDCEDAMNFEVLKTEETIDYGEYRRNRLKQCMKSGSRRVQRRISMIIPKILLE
ncbi:MAG: hypothetical protein C5S49_06860 [Candidatus Methanogaster sp.]|nr:MAG: hypothetical protein C5S49_06860 [ANME-2 cluster archaeon]